MAAHWNHKQPVSIDLNSINYQKDISCIVVFCLLKIERKIYQGIEQKKKIVKKKFSVKFLQSVKSKLISSSKKQIQLFELLVFWTHFPNCVIKIPF